MGSNILRLDYLFVWKHVTFFSSQSSVQKHKYGITGCEAFLSIRPLVVIEHIESLGFDCSAKPRHFLMDLSTQRHKGRAL